jgi:hypothetical protein
MQAIAGPTIFTIVDGTRLTIYFTIAQLARAELHGL